jgi:cell division protein FtsX
MSKQLFELMREQEAFPVQFGKRDYISRGKEITTQILNDGEIDKIEFWSKVAKLKELVNAMDSQLRESIQLTEKLTSNGVEFNPTNGGVSINYEDDPIYCELKKDLKEREELLKIAQKSTIFDAYGNEVPRVSTTPRKSSITIKF